MPDPATEKLFARLDELAPEGYNFGFHIRYSRPALVRNTYRSDWSREYSRRKFILNDPAVVWPLVNDGARRWSEIDMPDPLGVFPAAAEAGYAYGAAFGYGPVESRSLGSIGRGDREFTDAEIAEIEGLVRELHVLTEEREDLRPRQRAALELFASGRTYDAICFDLGISRTALKNRLRGARRVLNAETNTEAAQRAQERGLLGTGSYLGITSGLPRNDRD
ncbi:LuxR family transcriptional regulator [Tranquillimonas rosea]|uniref:LuxR family transcriptional regulator n=1 Tax=Tranquillimonas rosea TaxID=641238 RepID=A0A1H9WQ11_9RHOB|nr:autoinducer binding domain-containing protein [Tranquillimonas rosea]SES36000.1 LuxR family transcriptional regulator [Tranquillimonas rosea]